MTNFLYADKIELLDDTNSKGAVTDAKPIYWDIRFSNLCNFKCRICGHHSSSQWHSDAKQLDELSYSSKIHSGIQDFNKLFIQLVPLLNTVEEIYFAGGEPLIMAEHYQIIDALIKAGRTDVKLRYNTNFSTLNYKGSSLLERWAKFKDVFVHASLDDQNGKAELHRAGTDWSQIMENRARLRQSCSHIDFMLTPTISVFNVFSLFEFHKNCVIMGFCQIDEFMPHSLKNPNYYSIQVLPEFLKLEVEQLFKQHVDWIKEYCKKCPPAPPRQDQVDKWAEHLNMLEVKSHTGHVKVDMLIEELIRSIDFMWANDTSNLIPVLIERTQKLDELRGENTFEVIPEFNRILEFNEDF